MIEVSGERIQIGCNYKNDIFIKFNEQEKKAWRETDYDYLYFPVKTLIKSVGIEKLKKIICELEQSERSQVSEHQV